MPSSTRTRIIAFGLALAVAGVCALGLLRPQQAASVMGAVRSGAARVAAEVAGQLATTIAELAGLPAPDLAARARTTLAETAAPSGSQRGAPIVGVVRSTEIRVAPEVGGQLAAVKVKRGDHVHKGDVLAELSALELTAVVAQARAALAAAVASRENVYAGERKEQIAMLAAEIAKAESRLAYAQSQLTRSAYLAPKGFATLQVLDQAENNVATARADLAEAQANHAVAKAGPTREQRAIADAEVLAATAGLAMLERRLDKTVLRAPADGIVSVIVAEVGEAVRAGQPVLVIEAMGGQWLSFNVREDDLGNLAVGATINVSADAEKAIPALVTEIQPLGSFATWQAERAIGDHDRSTLRLRLDMTGATRLEPGMTVWLDR